MMIIRSRLFLLITLLASVSLIQGCTVIAIADAAASTVVGVGKVAVKGTVAVVDAAIPDGDDEEEEDEDEPTEEENQH